MFARAPGSCRVTAPVEAVIAAKMPVVSCIERSSEKLIVKGMNNAQSQRGTDLGFVEVIEFERR